MQGKEEYAWNIDYLRAEKDNAMQYICGVQNPNQMSIGRLTFSSPNACEGVIWVMDGTSYKFNAYRITPSLVEELHCRQLKSSHFKHFSKKRVILDPKEYNLFAIKYAQKMHFERDNMQILYSSVG